MTQTQHDRAAKAPSSVAPLTFIGAGTSDGHSPIAVRNLSKTYKVHEREAGLRASLASLVRRRYRDVRAVDDISFEVAPGEIVGFLGPNGAGKTTTLKMLSGLLHPTSGTVRVLGYEPFKRDRAYLRRMSMVMGNKGQLQWDIPAGDAFLVNKVVYRLSDGEFRAALDELTELLELGPLIKKQVRSLSLGERMKCELAAALLHRPMALFLDEPTIGLDVTMQARIRSFIAEYNERTGATVLLTSHYMADVVALCKRVIVIHHGRLLYDGALAELSGRIAPFKLLTVQLEEPEDPARVLPALEAYGEIESSQDGQTRLRVRREQAPAVTARLLAELPVADLSVEDPPIEDVIDQVFSGASLGESAEPETMSA
jgi:ABC-2 type transport system ATP-binding protein